MSRDCLRTGDKACVHFRFIKNPEYIRVGMRMVFREGRTKAVGNITKLYPQASAGQALSRSKPNKMQRTNSVGIGGGSGDGSGGELGSGQGDAVGGMDFTGGKPDNEPRKPSKKNRHRHRGGHKNVGCSNNLQYRGDREQMIQPVMF